MMKPAYVWLTAAALALATAPALSDTAPTSAAATTAQKPGTEAIDPRLHEIHPDEMIDVSVDNDEKASQGSAGPTGPGRLPAQTPRDSPQASPRIQNNHDSAYDTPGTNPGAYTDAPDRDDN